MTAYPSDLSDVQWAILSKFFDTRRRRKHGLREVVNAVMYLVESGCQWRMLPSDFPGWKLVYYYYAAWRDSGLWEAVNASLVEARRAEAGRGPQPTAGSVDSQSVKNTLVAGQPAGYDAGKKVKGVKRHIAVDTQGHLLAVEVGPASVQDRDGAAGLLDGMAGDWRCLRKLWADGGYAGKLVEKAKKDHGIDLEIIKKPEGGGFQVLPRRWVVERTFAWLDTCRRNSKNYERLKSSSEAMVLLASIKIMLKRF